MAARSRTRLASPSTRSRMSAPAGPTTTRSTSSRTIRACSAGNSSLPQRVEPGQRLPDFVLGQFRRLGPRRHARCRPRSPAAAAAPGPGPPPPPRSPRPTPGARCRRRRRRRPSAPAGPRSSGRAGRSSGRGSATAPGRPRRRSGPSAAPARAVGSGWPGLAGCPAARHALGPRAPAARSPGARRDRPSPCARPRRRRSAVFSSL